MRYQAWWLWEFPHQFRKAGFEVAVIGESYADLMKHRRGQLSSFSPVHAAIEFENAQIDEYMNMDLRKDDILFLADLSFPGFFANALYHKRPSLCYAFCHATSLNDYDYFGKVRHSKFLVEQAHSKMFANIFVGSQYHATKLACAGWFSQLDVVGVPLPPKNVIKPHNLVKVREFISTARPSIQKVDIGIENVVTMQYNQKIHREDYDNWDDYSKALSESRILLITSKEETFGYQVVDAIINNCIPVAPNAFSYPELLPSEYCYSNTAELFDVLDNALSGNLQVPELLCKERTKNFFPNIIQIMRKESDSYPF